jgi:hypothetical protein
MSWAAEELSGINLGDKRLDKRSITILDALGGNPINSIPAACNGYHETKAAYRFFDNANVTPEKVLMPHKAATLKRIEEQKVVLCVQDTTELDFSGQKENVGMGVLNHNARRGLYLHPTLAITPDRLCLGIISSETHRRNKLHKHFTEAEKKAAKNLPIEEKESYRWLTSYLSACEVAQAFPEKTIVSVGDRECDSYEFFIAASERQKNGIPAANWLIRLQHDRATKKTKETETGKLINQRLREIASQSAILGHINFTLPARAGKPERTVIQTVQVVNENILPPKALNTDVESIPVTAILTKEIDPPEGEDPIEWMLLTNVDVKDNLKAIEIIKWYLARWEIEIYFKILKSGCHIEELQLETEARIDACLAMYMIVAWRILYFTMLGRACPDVPCDVVFHESEWKSVYEIHNKKKAPEQPIALNEMIILIGCLGGHLNRKSDGFPGPKKMWIGMQKMRNFTVAREALLDIYG